MANNRKQKALNKLFDRLVDAFNDILDEEEVTSSDLNTIRQFLKDNGIDVMATDDDEVSKLAGRVFPFPKHTGEDKSDAV